MSWRDEDSPPPGPDGWRTLGWSCAALLCAGLLSALALPGTTPTPFGDFTSGDFFRPQWWVLSSFAAYPLFFASRSSWRVAVPLVAVVVAQLGYIVNRAVSDMSIAGLAGGPERLWYAAWAVQSLVMIVAAGAGARMSLRARHWERRMRRAVGQAATAVVGDDVVPGRPEGERTAG